MDFQGTGNEGDNVNLPAATDGYSNVVPNSPTNATGIDFRSQRPSIPPAPFFQGFHGMGSQMPFMFPHPIMPPPGGRGFAPPTHDIRTPPIDLTGVSQKQSPEECVTEQSKPTKKRRATKKKPDIVVLDDINDEVDVQKNIGHWKDHWVIQLITVRGEMHSIFSAPPKQGNLLQFLGLCK